MKGQISFDFVIALSIALILLSTLMVFSDNFLMNQEKASIRAQEKQIAHEINQLLLYSSTLKNGTSYKIVHTVPKIFLSGPPGNSAETPIKCNIDINATNITITVNNTHFQKLQATDTIAQTIDNTSKIIPAAYSNCGSTITIP